MALPRPFGLALSGGGFRATAFHLGVLKRLRELGLLEQVDILSTVSGGTLAGALWIHWQAKSGDTIKDPAEWDKFEASLIGLMRAGLREQILWRGFFVPFFLLAFLLPALVLAVAFFDGWPIAVGGYGTAPAVAALTTIAALAYGCWHYLAARLFQRHLDRAFFKGATLGDLWQAYPPAGRCWPHLIMNATGLNSGDHLLFTPGAAVGSAAWKMFFRALPDTTGIPRIPGKWRPQPKYRDVAPRVAMPLDTPLAHAVVASCAIPSVFAPLKLRDPTDWWEWPSWWKGQYRAVDGGVGDNQGTQFLLDGHCRGVIVSDAAAVLKTEPSPSTWQMLPLGRGVVFRSQAIIYERMRDLGYRRLEERAEFSRILRDGGGLAAAEEREAAILDGFAFVEIWPSDQFRWSDGARLPDVFYPLLADIRTDLDRFSDIEISALMYHGYTSIDHCLRRYQPDWLTRSGTPLAFRSSVAEVDLDWAALPRAKMAHPLCHLVASDTRVSWWRGVRRWLVRWRLWREISEAERASD